MKLFALRFKNLLKILRVGSTLMSAFYSNYKIHINTHMHKLSIYQNPKTSKKKTHIEVMCSLLINCVKKIKLKRTQTIRFQHQHNYKLLYKMQVVYFRQQLLQQPSSEEVDKNIVSTTDNDNQQQQLLINFHLKYPDFNVDRQFNCNRKLSEKIEIGLERIRANVEKEFDKTKKKQKHQRKLKVKNNATEVSEQIVGPVEIPPVCLTRARQ